MSERSADWLRQAERDLRHARNSRDTEDWEWSAFAAHQAAEKGTKALFQKLHLEAWGHGVTLLLGALPEGRRPDESVLTAARELDRHYLVSRYPNGFSRGAPVDYYGRPEAEAAIAAAEAVLAWCRRQIDR